MAIGPMDFQDWCELNQGLERQGEDDVPQHVQKRIYNDVVSMRVPEFFRPQARCRHYNKLTRSKRLQ